ncbi:MAG: Sir2 family NAD-dependent protein deacetylase [Nannocystaceae bacterium]|nr:RNA polymerase subunit sigma [Myxococcales bacterium]
MDAATDKLHAILRERRDGEVLVVTGAGVSAESGVPTFRGKEGYWTVGAREYQPMELATLASFRRHRREVWRWYLYRRGVCRKAAPNPGHAALARLEEGLGDRFHLATQNVDGLHLRAGNSMERTYQIHGNIDFMRAAEGRGRALYPIPEHIQLADRDAPLTDEDYAALVTPAGEPARPHVLWFDEYYEEELYRSDSAMTAACRCDLLIIAGTSGAAALPHHVAAEAARARAAILNIDPTENPFGEFAQSRPDGLWLQGTCGRWLPPIVDALLA